MVAIGFAFLFYFLAEAMDESGLLYAIVSCITFYVGNSFAGFAVAFLTQIILFIVLAIKNLQNKKRKASRGVVD